MGILKESKDGKGVDLVIPLWKKLMNYFHQPWTDECCTDESPLGKPVGYDSDGEVLKYYDPATKTIEEVSVGGGGAGLRYGLEDSISLQDRLVDNDGNDMAIENTSEFFTGSGYQDTSENAPDTFISDFRTGQSSIAAIVTDGTDVFGTTVDETGTKIDGVAQDDTTTKVLSLDSDNYIKWIDKSTLGGGGDNFANSDLTANANRTHDFDGNSLDIKNLSSFNIEGLSTILTVPFVDGGGAPPIFAYNYDGTNDGLVLTPDVTSPTINVVLNVDGTNTGDIVFTRGGSGVPYYIYTAPTTIGTVVTVVNYSYNNIEEGIVSIKNMPIFTGTPEYEIIVDGDTLKKRVFPSPTGFSDGNGTIAGDGVIDLGGQLTDNTIIDAQNFELSITGSNTTIFDVVNNTKNAIAGTGIWRGITGMTQGTESYLSYGVSASSLQDINNAGINPALSVESIMSSSTFGGFGTSIDFALTTNSRGNKISGRVISKWTDSSNLTSEFSIVGLFNSTEKTVFQLTGEGLAIITQGAPEYVDNTAATTAGLAIGTIYRTGDNLKIVH